MVQYNQYITPELDATLKNIAEKKKEELNKRHYSKTDVVLDILQKEAEKYL
jgi:hypothetical protein